MCTSFPAFFESLEPRQMLASTGLLTTYFNNLNFTGKTATRVDPAIVFNWPNHSSPALGIKGTSFSARWSGLVKPAHSNLYTFVVRNPDGVRLWVNGQLLIDSWKQSATASHAGTIYLQKDKLVDLRLEYFVNKRTANISLYWSSRLTTNQVVPRKLLFAYDTRVAAIGDYGRNNDLEAATANLVQSWAASAIVTVGDNNYPHGEAGTIDANIGKYFHNYIAPYNGSYGAGARVNAFFPALGDHEYDTQFAKAYLDYFTLPGNERYYDVVLGPLHCFILNSFPAEPDGTSSTSVQAQWLQSHLASSTSPFNIVITHQAPFSSGEDGAAVYMQWPFKEWGADAVLSGDNHDYERIITNNFPYIVNGAGSALGLFSTTPVPGTVVRDNSDAGALLVLANDQTMTLQYQLRSGRIVDTFTFPTNG
jgi:hypothetical protein